jgi:hypothetical protein
MYIPTHRTPGADPTAVTVGDRLTITLGDHGSELGVRVDGVRRTDQGVRIEWIEITGSGNVPHNAGAGFGTDLTGPEGGTWHWWNTRKPADRDPNNPPGRHRVITASGDGAAITRRAERYDATVAVFVAPAGADLADSGTDPGLRLTVNTDGTWTLAHERGGVAVDILAAGHIDRLPTPTGHHA